VKKAHVRLLVALLCLLFVILTGCQPTPEAPVVVGKNDGDNKVTSLFGETSETEGPYTAPESWKEETSVTFGGLSVTIDAKVTVPDVTKFPVVKVDDHVFSQEEADNILTILSEGNKLFSTEMTRADKEELLLVMKSNLAKFKAISSPTENDLEIIATYEEYRIPQLEAEIQAMPEGATAKPFTTNFQPDSTTGGMEIAVYADLGGENLAGISISNGADEVTAGFSMPSGKVRFGNGFTGVYWTFDEEKRMVTKEDAVPAGISITREEAIAQSEVMLSKLGLNDMYLALTIPASLCTTLSTTDASKQCWMFIYVPIVNGIPIEMEKENMRARYKHAVSTNEEYNASFSNPVVSFQIDDSGIDMWWDGPIDIQETLNENAVLLPFDQIQTRISQQLPIKYAAIEGITQVHVTSIELNYMRARIKNTQDGYMLLPVWDVIGYTDEPLTGAAKGPKANPEDFLETLLTISAIDGSVLDRRLGY
jgi:hypothetical protein